MTAEPRYIILLGPPASGKGTQANRLRVSLGLPHIASGDLFRANLKNETELGLTAKAYMDRGELVPDAITIGMVMARLDEPDCTGGALFDGFPRTIPQAEALDRALTTAGSSIAVVLNIVVPDDVLVERVSGRRLCPVCGRAYHVRFNAARRNGRCDDDGGKLYQRADDRPEVVRQRLAVYWKQTSPLVAYYRDRGILAEIDGDRPIDDVTGALCSAISARTEGCC